MHKNSLKNTAFFHFVREIWIQFYLNIIHSPILVVVL